MTNIENIYIAKDTIKFYTQGYYMHPKTAKKVLLYKAQNKNDIYAVDIYSPDICHKLVNQGKQLPVDCATGERQKAKFLLKDADSFEAARGYDTPLVMNFANAYVAGGGFLTGSHAQEECLCRNSTLYASISSDKAKKVYDYNCEHTSPLGSDYILLSPFVSVFRDKNCNLLESPFKVSVVTMAAPVAFVCKDIPTQKVNDTIYLRLKSMLCIAKSCNYKTLVLGAWGCGAFGGDPVAVAKAFYALFMQEGFCFDFQTVIFAIFGKGKNYNAFQKVFNL